MSDRVGHARVSSATPPHDPPQPHPDVRGTPAQLKHCWVVDEHGRLPALLLGWRRLESGYQGRVIRPIWDAELGWVVVEEWLPSQRLEPA